MQGIKVQRYTAPTDIERATVKADMEQRGIIQDASPFPADTYGGIIEPDDRSWIIWLDPNGVPSRYYPRRDRETGAVECEPILLKRLPVTPA